MYTNFETVGYVYILASGMAGTLYIGVTSDLVKRVSEHRESTKDGFTSKYKVYRQVYHEQYGSMELAIKREKQLKGWNRAWKIRLIEETNPKWDDLFSRLVPDSKGSSLRTG